MIEIHHTKYRVIAFNFGTLNNIPQYTVSINIIGAPKWQIFWDTLLYYYAYSIALPTL